MFSPRVFVTRQIFPEALELIEEAAQSEVWPEERPIVSFALAAGLFAFVFLSEANEGLQGLFSLGEMLGSINLTLGLFNLIPGFPLDGGRVLRAGLWAWSGDFYRATRQASAVGQGFGLAFGLFGASLIVGSMTDTFPRVLAANGGWMILIGLFLFIVAKGSRHQAAFRASLSQVSVRELMAHPVLTVDPDLNLEDAATRYFMPHGYRMFPVVEAGRPVGMITTSGLQAVPQALWVWRRVRDVMEPWSDSLEVPPDVPVLRALELMIVHRQDRLVVTKDGLLVGLITRSRIGRFLELRGRGGTP